LSSGLPPCGLEIGKSLGCDAGAIPGVDIQYLLLLSNDGESPVIPDSFLGGSAPRLQFLDLNRVPFPGLPNLLLSATQLVRLNLHRIPYSEYISPEAMVAPISMLSNLEFTLQFRSPQSRPDWGSRSLPPPKRSILPALRTFRFSGVTEYLEDLVTHIDAPQLNTFSITFFNKSILISHDSSNSLIVHRHSGYLMKHM
jgi:hypothetical protein